MGNLSQTAVRLQQQSVGWWSMSVLTQQTTDMIIRFVFSLVVVARLVSFKWLGKPKPRPDAQMFDAYCSRRY